jgi:plasmid stability protein
MKNITLSVPDEVYREARIAAARHDTSVSALVASLLQEIATGQPRQTARVTAIDAAFDQASAFSAADRLNRDQVNDRSLSRL